jgi:predicted 2-oxoglutarate/Fe(II)-dependent dioxygenase YbiX
MIKLTSRIFLFTDLFEDKDISQIFSILENCKWQLWGRANDDKIGELFFVRDNKDLSDIINRVSQKCLNQYMEELNIDQTLHYNDCIDTYIRKWDYPMKGMTAHRDHAADADGNAFPIRYTLCGYLNDDYEGALLEFPEYNLSIKMPARSAIVFPSNELHQVTDLIDKDRYMWSCFVIAK